MMDYPSLISTSIHILCFKWLEEPLHLISFLLDQISVNKVTNYPAVNQGKGVNDLCFFICEDEDGNANGFFIWV